MVYIPFWICIFAGVAIDARERRFPNGLAGACAVAALAGVWLDLGLNTALDHAGLAVIVYLALVLTESLWRRLRHAPGIGMGMPRRSSRFARSTLWVASWHLPSRSWSLPSPASSQNRAPCHCSRFWCRFLP